MSNFRMFETGGYGEPVYSYSDLEESDVVRILDAHLSLAAEEKENVLEFVDFASYGEFLVIKNWFVLCMKRSVYSHESIFPGCDRYSLEAKGWHCLYTENNDLHWGIFTPENVLYCRANDIHTAWYMAGRMLGQSVADIADGSEAEYNTGRLIDG